MAKLSITHSTNRIRIDLFNERIRVRKARELTNEPSIHRIGPAEVGWSSGSEATPADTRDFANWLTVAAGLADDLDWLIVSEADFGRVVTEGWPTVRKPTKVTKRLLETINIADRNGKIIINYPAAWVE